MATYILSEMFTLKRHAKIANQLYLTRLISTTLNNKSNNSKQREYKKCCEILEISESSDSEQIRRAYLHLVKKYHPDNPNGNLEKFQEVDRAFRTLIQRKARERWDVEEAYEIKEEEFDIKHTAPQHRQYLSNEGVGVGTPFQREKQYRKIRVMNAADNVMKHRIAKVTASDNDNETSLVEKKPLKHKIKTQYGFDRLVEDLIQESMSKGEFNNLSGTGKPLKTHSDINPYVDFITYKINQVLIDNGFTPEWITLQKDIREDIDSLRQEMAEERDNFNSKDDWKVAMQTYLSEVVKINKRIDKFNLVVPILNKQMTQIILEREIDKAENFVVSGQKCEKKIGKIKKAKNEQKQENQSDDNIFSLIGTYFKF